MSDTGRRESLRAIVIVVGVAVATLDQLPASIRIGFLVGGLALGWLIGRPRPTPTTQAFEGRIHVGRPRVRPTRSGWIVLIASVVIGFRSLWAAPDVALLLLAGTLLCFVLASVAATHHLGQPDLIASVPAPAVAFSGTRADYHVHILSPSGSVFVEGVSSPWPATPVEAPASITMAGDVATAVYPFVVVAVGTSWPLDLVMARRRVCFRLDPELAVAPAPDQSTTVDDLDAPLITGSLPSDEVIGVRPHQQGDSLRDIHWPAIARTGRLVSRQRSRRAPGVRIVVQCRSLDRRDDVLARARAITEQFLAGGTSVQLHLRISPSLTPGLVLHADHVGRTTPSGSEAQVGEDFVVEPEGSDGIARALASVVPGEPAPPDGPHVVVDEDGARWR